VLLDCSREFEMLGKYIEKIITTAQLVGDPKVLVDLESTLADQVSKTQLARAQMEEKG
jgi:hypothetical protein